MIQKSRKEGMYYYSNATVCTGSRMRYMSKISRLGIRYMGLDHYDRSSRHRDHSNDKLRDGTEAIRN